MPVLGLELPFDTNRPLRNGARASGLAIAYHDTIPGLREAIADGWLKPVSEYKGILLAVARFSGKSAATKFTSALLHITLLGDADFDAVQVMSAEECHSPASKPFEWGDNLAQLTEQELACEKGAENSRQQIDAAKDALSSRHIIVPEQCIGGGNEDFPAFVAGIERTFVGTQGSNTCCILLEVTRGTQKTWDHVFRTTKSALDQNFFKEKVRLIGYTPALVEKTEFSYSAKMVLKKRSDAPVKTYNIEPKLKLEEASIRAIERQIGNSATVPSDLLKFFLFWGWENNASDIHMQAEGANYEIRARIDGEMCYHPNGTFDLKKGSMIVNTLMMAPGDDVMAPNVKSPQGAKLTTKFSRQKREGEDAPMERITNLRIEVAPQATATGEEVFSAVIRIPSSEQADKELKDLFPFKDWVDTIERALLKKGILLVTGETGSGKSTTLAAGIKKINLPGNKIISIEKPIEIIIPRVVQYEASDDPKKGRTMAQLLRSALRQDPDTVYVGEIREYEEAKIAMDAAATGHGVLTTVHTNNPFATITRLVQSMGIDRLMVSSNVRLILSQILEKRPCVNCHTWREPSHAEIAYFTNHKVDAPIRLAEVNDSGCTMCRFTGYKGRQAVPAFLEITDDIRQMIANGLKEHELEEYAKAHCNYKTMQQNGLMLAAKGYITLEQAMAILY